MLEDRSRVTRDCNLDNDLKEQPLISRKMKQTDCEEMRRGRKGISGPPLAAESRLVRHRSFFGSLPWNKNPQIATFCGSTNCPPGTEKGFFARKSVSRTDHISCGG